MANDISDQGDLAVAQPAIDVEALKARYRQERDKRMRPDGAAPYVTPTGRLSHYLEDPYADPEAPREPVVKDVEAALIGAGWGGIQAAVQLVKAGIDDFLVLDRAGDFGGVWYWNRYPGIACDIESHIYMPMLEEMGYTPTEKYAKGPEIFRYAREMATKFDLYRRALFRCEIQSLTWDDEVARWVIRTDRGDVIRARFVNLATGPLQRPRLPAIPGIDAFKGHAFHTSRWDYAYTGGDSYGGLDKLKDKRVGIIGTGASAVQAVPHLAKWAKQLFVFQRTPAPVPVRNNAPTDPAWVATLEPGWQQRRMDNFNILVCGGQQEEDLVADGWTEIMHRIGIQTDQMSDDDRRNLADFEFMENIRARVDAVVQDKATAEALKPWYNAGCKRPCFHDDYLAAFNNPNVTLVDTGGRGVERVTEHAAIVGDTAYELDCLIFATGFEFNHTDFISRNGFDVVGRGGKSLAESRKREGISTLHGFMTRGFPNCVFQANAQGGMTPNITHSLGEGAKHFAYLVKTAAERDLRTIEPTEAAERAWVDRVHSISYRTRHDLECTPGYYNNDGRPTEGAGISAFYPGSPHKFMESMARWRAQGELEGMDSSGWS